MNSNKQPLLTATPSQEAFIKAFLSGKFRYMLYGGAIRSGKTVVLLMLLFMLCKIYPKSRWAVVRKDLPTLKRNFIPAFEKFAPRPFFGKVNRQDWTCTCKNGSQILFFPESFDTDKDLNRWKGLEVNGFFFEEMNEMNEAAFSMAKQRAGAWIIPGLDKNKQPAPVIFGSCNPADNWVKKTFYQPAKDGILDAPYFFQAATPADNPHLPAAYMESLEELKESDENAYNRFVLGDWDFAENPNQLISWEWLYNAMSGDIESVGGDQYLGCDVARSASTKADDSCLIYRSGNTVQTMLKYHGMRTDELAETILRDWVHGKGVKAENIIIDTIGIGIGVYDHLYGQKIKTTPFVAGERPYDTSNRQDLLLQAFAEAAYNQAFTFKNKRSQAWYYLRELFRNGLIRLDLPKGKELTMLCEELTAVNYDVAADRVIVVESKDSIKKRIGRSTDRGDALMQAFAPVEKKKKIIFI